MALGMSEIIIILLFLACLAAVVFAAFFFLSRYLTVGGKTCPYCAEKIKAAAKVCRYCQRDVTGV